MERSGYTGPLAQVGSVGDGRKMSYSSGLSSCLVPEGTCTHFPTYTMTFDVRNLNLRDGQYLAQLRARDLNFACPAFFIQVTLFLP